MSTTQAAPPKPDQKILFQDYFKSVGPRTYAAQVKEAVNGNHFIVLTEGKRDDKTGEVRKTKLLVFSEDFDQFFKMVERAARHIRDNPVPEEIKKRQSKFWSRKKEPADEAAPQH